MEGTEPETLTAIDSVAGELSSRFPEAVSGGLLFTSWWNDSTRIMSYRFDSGTLTRVATGSTPRYVAGGYLVFGTREGRLQAVRFDSERLEPLGAPTSILDSVEVGAWGWVEFDLADNGALVYQPAWEPQRTLVAVDATGRESRFLTGSGPFGGGFEISPDGSRVSFSRDVAGATEIWVRTKEGAEWRVTGRGRNFNPTWSPDGVYLAFSSDREGRGLALYKQRADGVGEPELVLARRDGAFPVSWSPDGSILFWDDVGGFHMVSADGSGMEWTPVPDCARECGGYSRLSPNGRYIAYLKDRQLYVSDLSDPLATRQQVSIERGGNPRWSPDGREIYFYAREKLWAASVEQDPLRVVDRRELLELADRRFMLPGGLAMAIDPVSGRFVFRRDDGPPRPSLVMVLNYLEVLRERLGSQ